MAQPRLQLSEAEIAEVGTRIQSEQMTATQVQALVRKMDASKTKWKKLKQQGKKDEYRAKLKEENEILFYNYPSLFDLHLEDRLDSTFFEMLQLKRKIERGEITNEQASAYVGQQLFNRFVPHAIDSNAPAPAPRMSYEDYYKQTTNPE
jgi:hypothetical protein